MMTIKDGEEDSRILLTFAKAIYLDFAKIEKYILNYKFQ